MTALFGCEQVFVRVPFVLHGVHAVQFQVAAGALPPLPLEGAGFDAGGVVLLDVGDDKTLEASNVIAVCANARPFNDAPVLNIIAV